MAMHSREPLKSAPPTCLNLVAHRSRTHISHLAATAAMVFKFSGTPTTKSMNQPDLTKVTRKYV
jgi:hypothetical protein